MREYFSYWTFREFYESKYNGKELNWEIALKPNLDIGVCYNMKFTKYNKKEVNIKILRRDIKDTEEGYIEIVDKTVELKQAKDLTVRSQIFDSLDFKFTENTGYLDKEVNETLDYLFNNSDMLTALIGVLDLDTYSREDCDNRLIKDNKAIHTNFIGIANRKLPINLELLLNVLSDKEVNNCKKIIHTKTLKEILRDVAVIPVKSNILNDKTISLLYSYADRDFEVVEDIKQIDYSYIERINNKELCNKERKNSEFYVVKDPNHIGRTINISMFMVDTVRKEFH